MGFIRVYIQRVSALSPEKNKKDTVRHGVLTRRRKSHPNPYSIWECRSAYHNLCTAYCTYPYHLVGIHENVVLESTCGGGQVARSSDGIDTRSWTWACDRLSEIKSVRVSSCPPHIYLGKDPAYNGYDSCWDSPNAQARAVL